MPVNIRYQLPAIHETAMCFVELMQVHLQNLMATGSILHVVEGDAVITSLQNGLHQINTLPVHVPKTLMCVKTDGGVGDQALVERGVGAPRHERER